MGFSVTWSSPMMLKLKNETQTVLSRPITDEEGSWIVSIGFFISLLLYFTIGVLMDWLGRKTCIVLGCIPRLVMCFTLLFATEVWMLFLGKIMDGFSNVFILGVVPAYSSEIASKECRGALGSISQVASAVGMLIVLSIGPFMSYYNFHVVYACIIVTISLPLSFLPESPYFLYSKGKKAESLEVLKFLRGSEELANEELKLFSLSETKLSKREIFKDKTTLKTLGKVILLGIFHEIIGYNAVIFYMQTILESTHTSVRDDVASVINGCIQLVASSCTIVVVDRFGRKPVLLTSLFGMALGMIGLGTFFQLKQEEVPITGFLNFLPLLSMMLVVFCFNAGTGSILWTLIAELFDGPARAIGSTASIGVTTLFVFLSTKYFVSITNAIGAANTYWIFSCSCIINALFIMFFIPETKGKTFIQIQEELGKNVYNNPKS
uniref:Major facilitator superfamily (MFS) profile domain-containing protein n=1 Tax=Heliothis virescens TaxID=7102 RepID=A0A2A4IYC3_HELVI